MSDPSRLYRLLLRFYPARFREEYETPLERQFRDDYNDARGARGRLTFWLHVLRDLAISIPAEIPREVRQDLRCSVRVYRRRPLSTALALIALAMAIGATTGVFSVINALLLRSLPFQDPERLVQMFMFTNLVAGRDGVARWGSRSQYLNGAADFSTTEMTLSRAADPVRVIVTETDSNFFSVLGIQPAFGRVFAAEEGDEGGDRFAVIGYGLWRQLFGGDASVLGATVRLNGTPVTVIGVAPPGMDYPGKTNVWAENRPRQFPLPRQFGVTTGAIVGRLRPAISLDRAHAMFTAELRRAYPESIRQDSLEMSRFVSLRNELAGSAPQASMVLFGAVVFLLAIACSNVAQLLLSRTSDRRQELAVRAALGASRARLVQQLITEAVALTLAGAAAGLGVAHWASRLAASAQPAPLAAQAYTILDWRVLGFAIAAAILTGVVFGVLPAFMIGRMQPSQDFIRTQPGVPGSGAGRMRIGLVAAQTALTLVLLAGSVALGRSFLTLMRSDLGFRGDNVVSMTVSLVGTPYHKTREVEFYNAALDRLRAVPGVEAAGAVKYLPLGEQDYRYLGDRFTSDTGGVAEGNIVRNEVTSGYFRAMGTGLIAGREFTAAERQGKQAVVIVNEEFARRIGLGAGIVGRKITAGKRDEFTVVGVVRTIHLGGPGSPPTMQVYIPVEDGPPGTMTFVARVHGNAALYLAACRSALQQVDRSVPIYDVKTLDQRLDDATARPRFYTTAVLFLGGFALLLAVIGIYGVAAYSITQRTHEMSVRIALGAAPARLRATLVRQSMAPVAVGLAVGLAGAIASGKYLQHLIRSAEPPGIRTCALAGLALSATALAAVWCATSRVLHVDPAVALKAE